MDKYRSLRVIDGEKPAVSPTVDRFVRVLKQVGGRLLTPQAWMHQNMSPTDIAERGRVTAEQAQLAAEQSSDKIAQQFLDVYDREVKKRGLAAVCDRFARILWNEGVSGLLKRVGAELVPVREAVANTMRKAFQLTVVSNTPVAVPAG